jgi:putative FmdB family regulatory protein
MPIYEYRCENDHLFEIMQRISDGPVTSCQVCGAPVQRVFRPIAVHFKGSGFYNTDYGTRKRAREKSESGSSDGAASTSETSTKSDSTPSKPDSTGAAKSKSPATD